MKLLIDTGDSLLHDEEGKPYLWFDWPVGEGYVPVYCSACTRQTEEGAIEMDAGIYSTDSAYIYCPDCCTTLQEGD